MVKIEGKYKLVSNEKFAEHLIGLGIPEEKAKKVDVLKPTLEVKVDGKKITLASDSGILTEPTTFVLDEEVEEPLPLGYTLKSVAKLNGDTLTVTSKHEGQNKSGTRVYKFSDSELVVTLTSEDPKVAQAKRVYKRL